MKRHPTLLKAISVLLLVVGFYFFNRYTNKQNPDFYDTYVYWPEALSVHYIDVGQGDAAVMRLPTGETVLIDAGTNESERALLAHLDNLGTETIDYAVFSHPHEDHIGGADKILDAYTVEHVILPNAQIASSSYDRMLAGISDSGATLHMATVGDTYSVGAATLTVLGPAQSAHENLNNASVLLRVDYGEISFLFTGDTEADAEGLLMQSTDPAMLDADILKVAHHGSETSSSDVFLETVTPAVAVISCGAYNDYGHPHKATLDALSDIGATVFRTDKEGTVRVYTDGARYEVHTDHTDYTP